MKIVRLNLKENAYSVYIFKNKFSQYLSKALLSLQLPSKALVITHSVIRRYYRDLICESFHKIGRDVKLVSVPCGERAKTLDYFVKIVKYALNYEEMGDLFFVALGGGVIGDLVGFVASVYKRGVPYIQIPTTFLAQIDSSIGGKTAIDLPFAKNMVGSFWQPKAVIIYLPFLKTLPWLTFKDALAEAIKYGVIEDESLFTLIKTYKKQIYQREISVLEELVFKCVSIKAKIVEKDERETKSLRSILNFGHTIGHALEAATGFKRYTHGEAVSIGMVCASWLSFYKGFFKKSYIEEIEKILKEFSLPTYIDKNIPVNLIIKCLLKDKKFKDRKMRFVLPLRIGKVKVFEDIELSLVKRVIKERYA